jgi:hypothetical protein
MIDSGTMCREVCAGAWTAHSFDVSGVDESLDSCPVWLTIASSGQRCGGCVDGGKVRAHAKQISPDPGVNKTWAVQENSN